ncbi:MAG: 3-oxoacyl-[acyl-carrier-protein] synthase III C-terminal domain-containing protein [Planctomycetota bacterium]
MSSLTSPVLGISAIAVHEPSWQLDNGWFGDTMPRKFAHHTGIESRGVSLVDEVTMGLAAVRRLQRETGCDLSACRGIMFVSPSFIPASVARRALDPAAAAAERPGTAARRLTAALGIPRCRAVGINWFCCGYSRALELVQRRWAPKLGLRRHDYLLVVVATRISRITDYGCGQTAGLFGDMASATLIAPAGNRRHPPHFEIVHAAAQRQPADRPAFDFHVRREVPVPVPRGGRMVADERLVYSLDGMAIAEAAPRAMAAATAASLAVARLAPGDVDFVVPHQAGTGIVRFTGMQLDSLGIRGEVVNGLVARTGNVSACSVPHALAATWPRLKGVIACPTAAVGAPGRPEVLQGCVLLRATPHHERQPSVAA